MIVPSALDAHTDARLIVRLLQCHFCSLPVQQPVLLPCGNGLCRRCLPKSYKRENITYPSLPSRLEGFICPFEECRKEHALEDSSADVTLNKIMDRINIETVGHRMMAGDTPAQVVEKPHWRHLMESPDDDKTGHSRILHGGRLLSTFTMAELGELLYDSELTFESLSSVGDNYEALDRSLLVQIKEAIQSEMECQVCWALMLDPLTTTCGHSFCRRCVARLLDHANVCPVCRKSLSIRPGATDEPSNQRLFALLESFVPEIVQARAQIVEAEESVASETGRVPLFVCALSYPQMPTFLHVFEPRYRLMIRRAMTSDRKFGMVAYNARSEPQGALGVTQFMQYGTLLHIESMQLLPDGRSVIQTRGVSRFRIFDHDLLDDYSVGRTERIEDIPIAVEESLEASEISQHNNASQDGGSVSVRPLSALSTAELMQYCADFIERMHGVSASWLASNVLQAYGDMPNDPAVFPYWFASVLPINETEKYRLLPTTSVRERLKITAGWVRKVQGMRYVMNDLFRSILMAGGWDWIEFCCSSIYLSLSPPTTITSIATRNENTRKLTTKLLSLLDNPQTHVRSFENHI